MGVPCDRKKVHPDKTPTDTCASHIRRKARCTPLSCAIDPSARRTRIDWYRQLEQQARMQRVLKQGTLSWGASAGKTPTAKIGDSSSGSNHSGCLETPTSTTSTSVTTALAGDVPQITPVDSEETIVRERLLSRIFPNYMLLPFVRDLYAHRGYVLKPSDVGTGQEDLVGKCVYYPCFVCRCKTNITEFKPTHYAAHCDVRSRDVMNPTEREALMFVQNNQLLDACHIGLLCDGAIHADAIRNNLTDAPPVMLDELIYFYIDDSRKIHRATRDMIEVLLVAPVRRALLDLALHPVLVEDYIKRATADKDDSHQDSLVQQQYERLRDIAGFGRTITRAENGISVDIPLLPFWYSKNGKYEWMSYLGNYRQVQKLCWGDSPNQFGAGINCNVRELLRQTRPVVPVNLPTPSVSHPPPAIATMSASTPSTSTSHASPNSSAGDTVVIFSQPTKKWYRIHGFSEEQLTKNAETAKVQTLQTTAKSREQLAGYKTGTENPNQSIIDDAEKKIKMLMTRNDAFEMDLVGTYVAVNVKALNAEVFTSDPRASSESPPVDIAPKTSSNVVETSAEKESRTAAAVAASVALPVSAVSDVPPAQTVKPVEKARSVEKIISAEKKKLARMTVAAQKEHLEENLALQKERFTFQLRKVKSLTCGKKRDVAEKELARLRKCVNDAKDALQKFNETGEFHDEVIDDSEAVPDVTNVHSDEEYEAGEDESEDDDEDDDEAEEDDAEEDDGEEEPSDGESLDGSSAEEDEDISDLDELVEDSDEMDQGVDDESDDDDDDEVGTTKAQRASKRLKKQQRRQQRKEKQRNSKGLKKYASERVKDSDEGAEMAVEDVIGKKRTELGKRKKADMESETSVSEKPSAKRVDASLVEVTTSSSGGKSMADLFKPSTTTTQSNEEKKRSGANNKTRAFEVDDIDTDSMQSFDDDVLDTSSASAKSAPKKSSSGGVASTKPVSLDIDLDLFDDDVPFDPMAIDDGATRASSMPHTTSSTSSLVGGGKSSAGKSKSKTKDAARQVDDDDDDATGPVRKGKHAEQDSGASKPKSTTRGAKWTDEQLRSVGSSLDEFENVLSAPDKARITRKLNNQIKSMANSTGSSESAANVSSNAASDGGKKAKSKKKHASSGADSDNDSHSRDDSRKKDKKSKSSTQHRLPHSMDNFAGRMLQGDKTTGAFDVLTSADAQKLESDFKKWSETFEEFARKLMKDKYNKENAETKNMTHAQCEMHFKKNMPVELNTPVNLMKAMAGYQVVHTMTMGDDWNVLDPSFEKFKVHPKKVPCVLDYLRVLFHIPGVEVPKDFAKYTRAAILNARYKSDMERAALERQLKDARTTTTAASSGFDDDDDGDVHF